MIPATDDLRIEQITRLIAPTALMGELSITEKYANLVAGSRQEAERIIRGEDDRLLVVVGPCSIHDPDAAVEYGQKLKEYADTVPDELLIVMRVYFEKPRTTVGWKGLINDPDMDHTFDINRGLRVARKLLIDLLDIGIPAGTEFLDTISPQYVADLITWGAIGARTTESQVHRELASGISAPVGFKNGTGGDIQIAIDAINAARMPHHFLSVTKKGNSAIVCTKGNDACHVILRGSNRGTNYDVASIAEVVALLNDAGLPPYVMVDCSHGNSRKDFHKQPLVADSLCEQISVGSRSIAAIMLESHLVEGNQKIKPRSELTYGQSVTDACVSWETTVAILDKFAAAVRKRRGRK